MIQTDDEKPRVLLRQARQRLKQAEAPPPAFLRNKGPVELNESSTGEAPPLHIEAGLEPYPDALDRRRVAHLLKRTGFGASAVGINEMEGKTASELVDRLVDDALDTTAYPAPPEPSWANGPVPLNATQEELEKFIEDNIRWLGELQDQWFMAMIQIGLRERMTLFWHNHFVTQYDDYFVAMHAYRYLRLLRTHALGNFKTFVYEVGTDPAMLEYLDGNTNRDVEPNENYARELLELFTMSPKDQEGNDNYTQNDIEEIARALTGWIIDYINHTGVFIPSRFDGGVKTFFGRTGAFGYDDVIDIIFEERGPQTAYFICWKLYREFVYAAPDPVIVQELADVFVANDYEIAPVLRLVLKSAHFFDEQLIGAHVKSPIDLLVGLANEVMVVPTLEEVSFLKQLAAFLQQNLLNPPNVAGWPGHRTWISTTSLPIRWLITDFLLFGDNGANLVNLVPLAEQFEEASDPLAAFKLPVALAEHLMGVPVENLDIGTVSEEFGGNLVNFPIPDEVLNGPPYKLNLAKIFLGGLPWYEWNLQVEQAPILLALFARYLTQFPEFHLG